MPGIYVERRVRGSVDEVWRLTQTRRYTSAGTWVHGDSLPPSDRRGAAAVLVGNAVAARDRGAGTGESVGEWVGADGQLCRSSRGRIASLKRTSCP
jgi:hypothetical protein